MRSQLELYLDDWEQSSHDANTVGASNHSIVGADFKPVASCSSAMRIAYVVCHCVEGIVARVVCIVLRAVLSDTLHVATQSRLRSVSSRNIGVAETKSLCMTLVTSCDSPWQRCCIMCVLLLYYCCCCLAYRTLERRMSSMVYRYCHQSLWAMLFLYLLVPMLMGTMINAQIQRMLDKSTSCVAMATHLLSSIKRMQLVNMGGVISQPSPPIAQLESKLLSTMAGDGGNRGLLSCKAVRRGLYVALNLLTEQALCWSQDMQTVVINVNRSLQRSGIDAPDVSLLLHRSTMDEMGATDTPSLVELQHSVEAALDGYLSMLPSKLTIMLSRCYSLCNCGHVDLHGTGTHRDSYGALEGPLSQIYCRITLFIGMLSLLLRLPFYLHSMTKIMDDFEHDCCELGKLFAVDRSGGLYGGVGGGGGGGIVGTKSNCHCYHGHEYINMRRRLSCIRSAFDTISHRIWLAEELLCDPSVVEYWLSDRLSGHDDEEHRKSLQVLSDALSKLSGYSYNMREEGSAAGDVSILYLDSVELQLNSLPTMVDYKELFSHVELLQQAIAQCSNCSSESSDQSSLHACPTHPVVVHGDDLTASSSSMEARSTSSAGDSCLLESSVYSAEDDFGTTGLVSLSSSCATAAADGGVLDIYVTTIPSQTDRLAIGDRSEVAATTARSNDRSQRLFMTELRNRLHRIVPCVPNSDNSSTDRSGGASAAAATSDDFHRTSSFPTRYRIERVNELRLSDRVDAHDALEVRRVTTEVTRPSSLTAPPPSDALSDAFRCSSGSLRHDDSNSNYSSNMIRIGSLMVPRDQSEQYALQATTTTGRSALSESMTREITAGGNLFAALSARREAEVIAGDVDS